MVKFGAHLSGNIVPEWKYKFIDYKGFKKKIKNIFVNCPFGFPFQGSQLYDYRPSGTYVPPLRIPKDESIFLGSSSTDMVMTVADEQDESYESYVLLKVSDSTSVFEDTKGLVRFTLMPPVYLLKSLYTIELDFFKEITCEIDKVNSFFVEMSTEYSRKLSDIETEMDKLRINATLTNSKRKLLQRACKELYKGFRYLKNFSVLNVLGFSKLLKKHDKRLRFRSRSLILSIMNRLSMYNLDNIDQDIIHLESLWSNFFYDGNRTEMESLKQIPSKVHYDDTYLFGFFTGTLLSILLLAIFIITRPFDWGQELFTKYFHCYRFFFCLGIYMIGWAFNLYLCNKVGINVPFIFESEVSTSLTYMRCFKYGGGLLSLAIVLILYYFLSIFNDYFHWNIEFFLLPAQNPTLYWLIIFLLLCLLLFYPFNSLIKSTRFYILNSFYRIFKTPFLEVRFRDFFFGDQLMSLSTTLGDIVTIIFVFASGASSKIEDILKVSHYVRYVISAYPPFVRGAQCLRRYHDFHVALHLQNFFKYLFSFNAALSSVNRYYYAISQAISSLYSLYWDLCQDWGLFVVNNNRLRIVPPKRLFKNHIYYILIIFDVSIRMLWILRVIFWHVSIMKKETIITIMCICEIIRRSVWNTFRLENEQLNNCGFYRAIRDVPIAVPQDRLKDE